MNFRAEMKEQEKVDYNQCKYTCRGVEWFVEMAWFFLGVATESVLAVGGLEWCCEE